MGEQDVAGGVTLPPILQISGIPPAANFKGGRVIARFRRPKQMT